MASRALSTVASVTAIACMAPALRASAVTSNDNDSVACWNTEPRAALLLASCVAHPPSGKFQRQRFGNATDEWFAYVGYRAEALDAIRMQIGDKLLSAYHEHGEAEYAPFAAWCRQPDVTQAIDAALAFNREA